jgi:hypothetical protein
MKIKLSLLFIAIISYFNGISQNKTKHNDLPIIGTWELISATSTQKDSTFSTFDPKVKMIKIINPDHFAFFVHDLTMGKEPNPKFSAGAGRYTLTQQGVEKVEKLGVDRIIIEKYKRIKN